MATDKRRIAAYLPLETDEAFKAFKIKNGFATEAKPSLNDSKALIEIINRFLEVEHSVTHSVSLPDNLVTTEQVEALRQEFKSKISELLGNSQQLTQRIETLETIWSTSDLLVERKQEEPLAMENISSSPVEHQDEQVSGSLSESLQPTQEPESESPGQLSVLAASEPPFKIPEEWSKGLSARKLEELWPVNRRAIGLHKDTEDFTQWSAEQDPHGIPWEYRKDTRKFYPKVNRKKEAKRQF